MADSRKMINEVWAEGFSHIVTTIRDFDKIVELENKPLTGYVVAEFLHGRFPAMGLMGGVFWRAIAEVADTEIAAALRVPETSLADCFSMFDRTCLGGRS